MTVREYPNIQADLPQLINELRDFFTDKRCEMIVRQEAAGGIVVQANSTLPDWTANALGLRIRVMPDPVGTRVETKGEKWIDKAIAIGVGVVLLAFTIGAIPLAAGGIGVYRQQQLTKDAWLAIDRHMARESGGSVTTPTIKCRNCGTTSTGARFCPNCGNDLTTQLQR